MDPQSLVPTPDAIPVAWPWFKVLLIPCFAIHLLFMNALLGSTIICWVNTMRAKEPGMDAAESISKKLPFYMAFTINFGVAALLFMQVLYGHLFYTSSILMGTWWLATLALVLIAYGTSYWLDFKYRTLGGLRTVLMALITACLLLVGFVFVNNLTLMVNPPSWPRYFDTPGGTLWHWDDPTLVPRYLHFVTASVAVGGLLSAVLNRKKGPEGAAAGLNWFTGATAVQFIIGGWFFMALPQSIRLSLMGGDLWASTLFAITLLGVLMAFFFGTRQMLWPAVGATAFVVLGMVLVRDVVRTAYLAPYFSMDQLTVQGQISPMVVFFAFVLIGVAAVTHMLKLWKGAAS